VTVIAPAKSIDILASGEATEVQGRVSLWWKNAPGDGKFIPFCIYLRFVDDRGIHYETRYGLLTAKLGADIHVTDEIAPGCVWANVPPKACRRGDANYSLVSKGTEDGSNSFLLPIVERELFRLEKEVLGKRGFPQLHRLVRYPSLGPGLTKSVGHLVVCGSVK